jgi:hypothetical protein
LIVPDAARIVTELRFSTLLVGVPAEEVAPRLRELVGA